MKFGLTPVLRHLGPPTNGSHSTHSGTDSIACLRRSSSETRTFIHNFLSTHNYVWVQRKQHTSKTVSMSESLANGGIVALRKYCAMVSGAEGIAFRVIAWETPRAANGTVKGVRNSCERPRIKSAFISAGARAPTGPQSMRPLPRSAARFHSGDCNDGTLRRLHGVSRKVPPIRASSINNRRFSSRRRTAKRICFAPRPRKS